MTDERRHDTPPSPDETPWLPDALIYLGMFISVGGSLTIIVRGFNEWIYFLLIGFGLAACVTGWLMRGGGKEE